MSTVKITITRPALVRGERHEAGSTIAVSPPDAAALLDSGRALLADARDIAAVNLARRESLDQAMRIAHRRVVETEPQPWWRRVA